MNTIHEFEGDVELPLSKLPAGKAANEDSLAILRAPSASGSFGWDAFDVWHRMIKEPRDRRSSGAPTAR